MRFGANSGYGREHEVITCAVATGSNMDDTTDVHGTVATALATTDLDTHASGRRMVPASALSGSAGRYYVGGSTVCHRNSS